MGRFSHFGPLLVGLDVAQRVELDILDRDPGAGAGGRERFDAQGLEEPALSPRP